MDWFRSWHGAPTDIKWLRVARRSKVVPGVVSAIAWALLDHASQSEDRGDVSTFDIESYSVFSGFEDDEIAAVMTAMVDAGIIVNGRLSSWDKRQPAKEDVTNADRQRRYRTKRKEMAAPVTVTPRNAKSPLRSDDKALRHEDKRQIRTEQIRSEQNRSGPSQVQTESESESGLPSPAARQHDLDGSWEDYQNAARLEAAE